MEMEMKQEKKGSKTANIVVDGRLTDQKIRLRVSCSAEGWKALHKEYFSQRPKPFDPDFYAQFIEPALEQIQTKNVHRNSSFVLMMKAQAAILYLFFRPYFAYQKKIKAFKKRKFNSLAVECHQLKVFMQQHGLPFCFVRFDEYEKFIERNIREALSRRIPKSRHNPALYVAHCMQTVYHEHLDKNRIKPFIKTADRYTQSLVPSELNNFHKMYISQGLRLWKEHLELHVSALKHHMKHNSMELRMHTRPLSTFDKSLNHLYAFHYSKMQPKPSEKTDIFNFVGHALRAILCILSEGRGETLVPESKDLCQFFSEMFEDGRELTPYRYTLSEDERFILTQASSEL